MLAPLRVSNPFDYRPTDDMETQPVTRTRLPLARPVQFAWVWVAAGPSTFCVARVTSRYFRSHPSGTVRQYPPPIAPSEVDPVVTLTPPLLTPLLINDWLSFRACLGNLPDGAQRSVMAEIGHVLNVFTNAGAHYGHSQSRVTELERTLGACKSQYRELTPIFLKTSEPVSFRRWCRKIASG